MLPIRVSVKGFLSFREQKEFHFSGRRILMLSGKNGSGKSTVLDAIPFALYGVSRSPSLRDRDLIHHGENEFVVEFDFAVGADCYRIKRTVSRRGNSTRRVFRLVGPDGSTPQPIPQTDKEEGLKQWVAAVVGIDKDTFLASVLLRQGHADRFLSVGPTERHRMLGQIVDLSPYERLHAEAESRYKRHRILADDIQRRLDALGPWDEAEIARLGAEAIRLRHAAAEAQAVTVAAESTRIALAGSKGQARLWEMLSAEHQALTAAAKKARSLLFNAAHIACEAARLESLRNVLPLLDELITDKSYRDEIRHRQMVLSNTSSQWLPQDRHPNQTLEQGLITLCDTMKAEKDEITERQTAVASLHLFTLARTQWRRAAQEKTKAEMSISARQASISACLAETVAASQVSDAAAEEFLRCHETLSVSKEREQEIRARCARYKSLGDAAACTHCGQELTAEHRAAEEGRLRKVFAAAKLARENAARARENAQRLRDDALARLQGTQRDSAACQTELASLKREVKTAARNMEEAAKNAATAIGDLDETYLRMIHPDPAAPIDSFLTTTFPTDADLKTLSNGAGRLRRINQDLESIHCLIREWREVTVAAAAADRAVVGSFGRIPPSWKETAADATRETLTDLLTEEEALRGADLRKQELDAIGREQEDRIRQITRIEAQIEQIPLDDRRPVSEIEVAEEMARRAQEKAQAAAQNALAAAGRAEQTREEIVSLRGEWEAEIRDSGLHQTLSQLLNGKNLQRWLLQEAERAITEETNLVLKRLSDGNLRLELRHESGQDEGVDQGSALDLVAHNLETGAGPIPIDVLSGSQRFRVAVSLALGIGAHANRSGQRIQSVIIDEGFGSLDKDGRASMIEQVRALSGQLDCVILVSHQEEFSDAFEDRYELFLENNATQVRAVNAV